MSTQTSQMLIRSCGDLPAMVKRTAKKVRIKNESEVIRQALYIGLPELEKRLAVPAGK